MTIQIVPKPTVQEDIKAQIVEMDLSQKHILVTGGSGLVGQHLLKELERWGDAVYRPSSEEYDLRNETDVGDLFLTLKPQIVFNLAAKVGGILDNKISPADFYHDNILIGAHIYQACADHKVEKLVNVGAGCGYPLSLKEPLREEEFFDGLPQPESMAYSMAKKMLVVQGIAYRKQYGLSSVTLIPSNLYGECDNFNLSRAHVIPALVRKFYEAVRDGKKAIEVWGDGTAKRDFLHCEDFARALVDAALHYDSSAPLNIACGKQHSIREVVELLADISGFSGSIVWDTTKPSGQSSREMSTINAYRHLPDWSPVVDLQAGLARVYEWLSLNYAGARL